MSVVAVSGGIFIAATAIELGVWSYYGGLAVPLLYDITAPAASTALAPAVQGFAITAGVLGTIAITLLGVSSLRPHDGGYVYASGAALLASVCCGLSAIALAQYESFLLNQTIVNTMAQVEIVGAVIGSIVVAAGVIAVAASFIK